MATVQSVEKSGRTVDTAIDAALEELGLERDDVEVDILQIESAGILGIFGKKEGRVRVTPIKRSGSREQEVPEAPKKRPAKGARATARKAPAPEKNRGAKVDSDAKPREGGGKNAIPDEELAGVATSIVKKISDCFGISVEVEGTTTENVVRLRVVGESVGQLIGRRGKTLGAVQYMVSRLINEDRVAKKKVVIDVDGYNEDREVALKELAEKTTERVLHNDKPSALRPMNPQERRLIHVTLQGHEKVATESFGEEGSRMVVVYPRSMDPSELKRFISNELGESGRRPPSRGGRRRGGNGRR
jgi:spoIIIJ-associated protein